VWLKNSPSGLDRTIRFGHALDLELHASVTSTCSWLYRRKDKVPLTPADGVPEPPFLATFLWASGRRTAGKTPADRLRPHASQPDQL